MSIRNRIIVAMAFAIIRLSIGDSAVVNAQECAPRFAYYEEQVFFPNQKHRIRLAGTLSLPLHKGPLPAAVLITDAGPHDRNERMFGHKPFLVLADHLTRLGIAVLRVDDRGVGKSTGSFSDATSEDFAADALAGIDYLKTRKEIAHEEVGLVGHGEGGLIAAMAAAQSTDVAFVVMMAGPGLNGDQIILGSGGADLKGGWLSDEMVAEIRAAQERIFAIIKNEHDRLVSETKIRKEAEIFRGLAARIRSEAPESQKDRAETIAAAIENQIALFLSRWFRFYLMYDPRTALMKVKCPVLAVNGEKDIQVPARENLEAIREALKSGGNTGYTILTLPHLNHLFQTAETGSISEYDQIQETISVVALDTISNWIQKGKAGT
jgi:uncharacterized protein